MKHSQLHRALRNRYIGKWLATRLSKDLALKIEGIVLDLEAPKTRFEGFLWMFRHPEMRERRRWLRDRGLRDPFAPETYVAKGQKVCHEYCDAYELIAEYPRVPTAWPPPGVVWPEPFWR